VKRRAALSAIAALATLSLPRLGAAATEVAGVQVADQMKVGSQTLNLNGVGIRKKFGFSVYVCGLYLQKACNTLDEVIAAPGAKRILVVLLRDISSDEFGDAFLAGVRHNSTREQTRAIGLELVQLGQLSVALPHLRTGDAISYDYDPALGSSISYNGRLVLGPSPSPLFFEALVRIWLGDHPADDTLKDRLLGKKAPESTFNTGFRSGG
jgi:hypothetical protein